MYKEVKYRQVNITDFNQPFGLKMNQDNRWVKLAEIIPWEEIEEKYSNLFPSKTGMPAKPLRMALGSLMIQKKLGFSDRELIEEIIENPYLQYFIGLPGYQNNVPFVPSLLVEFRKHLPDEVLDEINELIIKHNNNDKGSGGESGDSDSSKGDDQQNLSDFIEAKQSAPNSNNSENEQRFGVYLQEISKKFEDSFELFQKKMATRRPS